MGAEANFRKAAERKLGETKAATVDTPAVTMEPGTGPVTVPVAGPGVAAAGVREDPMALPPGVDELLGKVKELSGQVVDLVRRIDAIEGPRKAREAEPYPCPRCGSTKTPIRGGVHASHAGIKRYRECRACAWTFSTIKTAGGEREA